MPFLWRVGKALFCLAMLSACLINQAFGQTVVANLDVSINQISRHELRAIFSMAQRNWPDGSPVTVYVLSDDNALHEAFCKDILNMFPSQIKKNWIRKAFSGTGQTPNKVDSVVEMRERISNTPGAVGYLTEDDLNESVKRIEVLP